MNTDDLIQESMRRLTTPDVRTTDLMARALTRASRRRRIRLALGAVVATTAIVAGTSVTTLALSGTWHSSSPHPSGQPTATTPTGPIEDLTGKALADALGLMLVTDCHGAIQQVNKDGAWLCLGGDWSTYEGQLLSYQLRGYERTDTLIAMAETYVAMEEARSASGPDSDTPDKLDLWVQYNALRDQLVAEQGAHPYTGFESLDDESNGG
jgi:hypothetical protein